MVNNPELEKVGDAWGTAMMAKTCLQRLRHQMPDYFPEETRDLVAAAAQDLRYVCELLREEAEALTRS